MVYSKTMLRIFNVAFYTSLISLIALLCTIMLTGYVPTVHQLWVHQLILWTSAYLFPIASTVALIAVLTVKATHPPPNVQRSLTIKHPVTAILFAIAVLWVAGRIVVLTLGSTD